MQGSASPTSFSVNGCENFLPSEEMGKAMKVNEIMKYNKVPKSSLSSLSMQGWESPTSFACKGWLKNGKKLEYS